MINGYIDVNTRTGTLDANINSCARETIEFNASFDAGLTVAILSVEGKTLALSTIEDATSNLVTINTMTVQAYEYTHELGAGQSLPIVIAIGDSNNLQALVTGRIQFNSLYDKAPPEDLAPAYPTSEELNALLAEMQVASNAAAQSATASSKSAEQADESASKAAASADSAALALTSSTNAAKRAEVAAANANDADTSAAENARVASDSAKSSSASAEQAAQRATAAQTAKTAAETAATAAQTAQGKAESAQAAAETAQKGAEAAKEAASQSATAAAQSAQAAAQGVATLLQGKVDAAEAAKSGAEAAKAAAETAKTDADAAKTAASSSAKAAANSATAAAKSATDLADAVSTAKSLDGRVTAIEDEGIAYYNPLKGTPFIIEREIIAGVYLVRLRDYPSHPFSLTSDGQYYIIQKHYYPGKVWLLDKDLKPIRDIATGFSSQAHSPAFIHNGQLWVSYLSSTWMPAAKDNIIRVYDVSDASSAPTVVAKTMKIIGDYNKNDIIALFLNRLTGNVLCIRNTMVNTGSYALEVYRLTVDGDTFAYEYVQTLDGISLSGNNPCPVINYFASRVFVTLVQSSASYASGFNPYGGVTPVSRSVESRLLVTGYDDKLHWIDTALPPDSNTSELPIRFGVSAVGTYFGSSVSSNIMTSATPGLQYHSTKSYTDKNGVSRPAVLMTNGVATFRSDGEDDDGNLIWKTDWDAIFNSGSFGLFTPAGAYKPVVLCAGKNAGGGENEGYLRPTALVYSGNTSLSAQAVGNCIRLKTTGTSGYGQNGIILLGESGNVGAAGFYGSSGGLVGSNYGVACDRHNATPSALVFTRP